METKAQITLTENSTEMRGSLPELMTLTSRLMMHMARTIEKEAGRSFADSIDKLAQTAHDMNDCDKDEESGMPKEMRDKLDEIKKRAEETDDTAELIEIFQEALEIGKEMIKEGKKQQEGK